MAGLGDFPADWRTTYDNNMHDIGTTYRDVIEAVRTVLPGAFMTQTGGMNAAIEAPIEGGWVWITDAYESLSWDRETREGWGVNLYIGDYDADPNYVRGDLTMDDSTDGLLTLLRAVVYDTNA
jgi:hypothetical protein